MSKPRTVRLPDALGESLEIRAKQLGYASFSDYLKGLARYDLLVQGKHGVTLPWSKMSLTEQDKIDDHLLELTKLGEGERGQFLERLIEKMKSVGKLAEGLNGTA